MCDEYIQSTSTNWCRDVQCSNIDWVTIYIEVQFYSINWPHIRPHLLTETLSHSMDTTRLRVGCPVRTRRSRSGLFRLIGGLDLSSRDITTSQGQPLSHDHADLPTEPHNETMRWNQAMLMRECALVVVCGWSVLFWTYQSHFVGPVSS